MDEFRPSSWWVGQAGVWSLSGHDGQVPAGIAGRGRAGALAVRSVGRVLSAAVAQHAAGMVTSRSIWHTRVMTKMTTIKVETTTRDGVRALAERQGVTMDVAIRRMTEAAEREMRFADLKAAMEANPPDEAYRAELADWESDAWN